MLTHLHEETFASKQHAIVLKIPFQSKGLASCVFEPPMLAPLEAWKIGMVRVVIDVLLNIRCQWITAVTASAHEKPKVEGSPTLGSRLVCYAGSVPGLLDLMKEKRP